VNLDQRIRIGFGLADPDPGGENDPQKGKRSEEI
jgi:hypothetical protein